MFLFRFQGFGVFSEQNSPFCSFIGKSRRERRDSARRACAGGLRGRRRSSCSGRNTLEDGFHVLRRTEKLSRFLLCRLGHAEGGGGGRNVPRGTGAEHRGGERAIPHSTRKGEGGIPLAALALSRVGDVQRKDCSLMTTSSRVTRGGAKRRRDSAVPECQRVFGTKTKQRRHRTERSGGRNVPRGTGAGHRGGERAIPPSTRKAEAVIQPRLSAERAGFEPANPFGRSRAFQTRLFSHSSTSPLRFAGANINKNMLTL